ncbi:hypothetical protein [Pseudoxanthomonas sp. 10H]|uniref:hypothetical protein n=1 Tax=Pseudoxanthomonas sp. 10H TaxID=3242729 RepID=UPI003555CD9E
MAVHSEAAFVRRPLPWGTGSGVWIAALLLLALAGFWRSYVSRIGAADAVTHLHAGLMLAWFAMLSVQPWLVRTRRLELHRRLGRVSYALVPAIVATCLGLSHLRMSAATPESSGFQAFILYLGMAASVMFLLFWGLAIVHRRQPGLHARYMVATALVMIDPALARLLMLLPVPGPAISLVSYGAVFALLGAMLWLGRGRPGQRAFVVVGAVFALNLGLLMTVPRTATWLEFARLWGGLPPA